MPLADLTNDPKHDERLATEARTRLAEYAKSTLLVYSNLMNYRHNNSVNVTPEQFDKALGSDAKELAAVLRAMRRILLKLNPAIKAQLKELAPKKRKRGVN